MAAPTGIYEARGRLRTYGVPWRDVLRRKKSGHVTATCTIILYP